MTRGRGRNSTKGEPTKTLPICLPVSSVEALDQAWKRLGYVSRISFIRTALAEKLAAMGEEKVAEMIGG